MIHPLVSDDSIATSSSRRGLTLTLQAHHYRWCSTGVVFLICNIGIPGLDQMVVNSPERKLDFP
jgi:hypothetical protein